QLRVVADLAEGRLVARQGSEDQGDARTGVVFGDGLVDRTEVPLTVIVDLILFTATAGLVHGHAAGTFRGPAETFRVTGLVLLGQFGTQGLFQVAGYRGMQLHFMGNMAITLAHPYRIAGNTKDLEAFRELIYAQQGLEIGLAIYPHPFLDGLMQ